MRDLNGLVAVVTGAGNGIGRAVALELGRAGMCVAVADLDGAAADSVADEVRLLGVASVGVETDVRWLDAVVRLADQVEAELGPARLLVNNAGVGLIEPIASITNEDWRWVMDVNFYGVVNGVQAFLPLMLAGGAEAHVPRGPSRRKGHQRENSGNLRTRATCELGVGAAATGPCTSPAPWPSATWSRSATATPTPSANRLGRG